MRSIQYARPDVVALLQERWGFGRSSPSLWHDRVRVAPSCMRMDNASTVAGAACSNYPFDHDVATEEIVISHRGPV